MFYLPFGKSDLAHDSDNPRATVGREALKRVIVVGTSGSGKTTFARSLASKIGAPHVEFDAYRHGPNWTETPNDIFRQNLLEALSEPVWVADGNYSVARDVVWPRAAAIVWLDYPFPLTFWRLFWRTIGRAVRRTKLWNGNRENLWEHFFTRDSLLLWAIQTHWSRRRRYRETLQLPEYSHITVFHMRWPKTADALLNSIAQSAQGPESVV